MPRSSLYSNATVKIYHGYGHTHDLVVYGHVLKNKPTTRRYYSNNILINAIHLIRMFFIKPLAGVKVQLQWRNQIFSAVTEEDGFFKFEWKSNTEVEAGWHPVAINLLNENGNIISTGAGKIFVPHTTQYAFISDIDDTILISHSASIGKRLRLLFTKNPRTRKSFNDAVKHYQLLAAAHTNADTPNPFFYVSSSEWNLYDDLTDFFQYHALPEGAFLLNQIKRWFQLLKTGKTKHEGKLLRVLRILEAFPKQQFVLLGDSTQSDPAIYAAIVSRYPEKIFAVYIRNMGNVNETIAREHLKSIENSGIYACFFKDNAEAIAHSKKIGLIEHMD